MIRKFLDMLKKPLFFLFPFFIMGNGFTESIETFDLDVIVYDDVISGDQQAHDRLLHALYEKGIVGIKGIPSYKEKVFDFIRKAREFSALPEKIKEAYAPNGEMFLGYEKGKEKFQRPDGTWVIDSLKASYYALVPDQSQNKWPTEVNLRDSFQELGELMAEVGEVIMFKIGMIGSNTGIYLDQTPRVGRMLYYRKSEEISCDHSDWCGAHFDHSMLTSLLPAFYFAYGKQVPEPSEAGLFVKIDGQFKKVVANDPDILMFQVGEFGQLVLNDKIRATKHLVRRASGAVERYTMALFCDAPMDTVIHSTSILTEDSRYGGNCGDPCSYRDWNTRTFERYVVKDESD